MSLPILYQTAIQLLSSPLIIDLEFLGTKIRARLPKDYILDIYYNATLQKYSYTIIKRNNRIIGWDNAPHHKHVETHPHHFHTANGRILPSKMKGNPTEDLPSILKQIRKILEL